MLVLHPSLEKKEKKIRINTQFPYHSNFRYLLGNEILRLKMIKIKFACVLSTQKEGYGSDDVFKKAPCASADS